MFFSGCKFLKMPSRISRPYCAALALIMALSILTMPAYSARSSTPLAGKLQPAIERFLLNQTAGLPGKVGITLYTPMSGALPACDAAEPFLPNGARLWGRVSVGVRCNAGRPWTRYVPAYIAVVANYYIATRAINAGEALAITDFALREGDLTRLPRSVITSASQLDGVIAVNRIASGAPLRQELLRGVVVVHFGQNVRVVTQGTGFVASTEGRAMTNAAIGAAVRVKTRSGRMVSGIAREDGSVELSN